MVATVSMARIEELRAAFAKEHADPRALHDEVQSVIDMMELNKEHVPTDLREAAEELQAEVLEEFYDNLPV